MIEALRNAGLAAELAVGDATYAYYPINQIEGTEVLPFSLRIVAENVLRNAPSEEAAREAVARIVAAGSAGATGDEIEFSPARVLFQDFTGVPVFVDLAVMREACESIGGDAERVNPLVPCNLVIDHSVIAESAGSPDSMDANVEIEFRRNAERYAFLKWSQDSFRGVQVTAPEQGICHQLNIEQIARVVWTEPYGQGTDAGEVAYFDTLVGTDSHTPTANGLGVLSWGVGGIEAEAAVLGQPITTLVPRVVGVKLMGELAPGVSGMDVALAFAKLLRANDVVGAFVECFGPGLASLSLTQRTCVSNMSPEYGCTCTLFPVDEATLAYLRMTGRSAEQIALVEAYARAQGLYYDATLDDTRRYAQIIEFDLTDVPRAIAGPSRPHDHIPLAQAKTCFQALCEERALDSQAHVKVSLGGVDYALTHGAIAIAAITSCTTATDPAMVMAAGLLARNANARGIRPQPWVKTILAPGSHAVSRMLDAAGFAKDLGDLGFYTCGFGCMSCIGNSGPLCSEMHAIAADIELASVLSGNRNFEGRISPDVSQNYLMPPALVVAYAIAGTMDIDLTAEPLAQDAQGKDVFLADIWPTDAEVAEAVGAFVTDELYNEGGQGGRAAELWEGFSSQDSCMYAWDDASTYIRRAPYFDDFGAEAPGQRPIEGARCLALLGDFVTTDHISPAGSIAPGSPAALYLEERGVSADDFNTYGARRGNHEVMMRGTFANVKLKNALAEGRSGGWTRDCTTGEIAAIFDAAQHAAVAGIPLVVIAGKMYGSGSSRDWAAKGPSLLGVRAVMAESYERIHRSNLVGMGILPLQFRAGESAATWGLDGSESFAIEPPDFAAGGAPSAIVHVTRANGDAFDMPMVVRIDTPTERAYYEHGGILPYVVRQLAAER